MAISAPILAAALLAAVGRHLPRLARDLCALAATGMVAAADLLLLMATDDGRVVSWVGGWQPASGIDVGIVLVADPMAAGLALLAAILVFAVLVFSIRYFEDVGAHYHVLVLLFLSGMTGFALSGDLFDLFVFFELMGAVAYALTGFFVEERTSVQGALNFGIVNSLGAYVSLVGISLLYARFQALGLPQLSAAMSGRPPDALVVAGFVLVCVGLLVKAAVVPFHFWTADAEAVAPSPVCVLFSGVMVVLGVYGVARVYWTAFSEALPHEVVSRALVVLGAVTAMVGAAMCFQQRHLKRLLAYSTIAHVGLFLAAVGTLDAGGTAGAAVYVLGHAAVKGALFLLAGLVLDRYGSVNEVRLHGRGRNARIMPWLFLLGGVALAGLPPFGTGLGKAISEEALSVAGWQLGPPLFVLVSALTGGAVLRAGARIYWGLGPVPADDEDAQTEDEEEEVPLSRVRLTMIGPVAALLAGGLALGVVPAVARGVGVAAELFVDRAGYVSQSLQNAPAAPVEPLAEAAWTPVGVALGLLSAVLAAGFAALALWAPRLPQVLHRAARAFGPALHGLRSLHSGRIGDYVAWLFLGTAVLGALVGAPLL